MGKGSSKSNQKAEGDVVFNNVDYGGQGSGAGALKNFNVGRENKLVDNVFNITDGGSTRNALAAGVAMNRDSNNTVQKGTAYALGSNEAVSKRAMDNTTATAFKSMDNSAAVTENAINAVTGTSSEAIKASKQAQELAAKQARESASQAYGFAESSNSQMSSLASRSQDKAYDLSRDAIGTYEDLVSKTGQQVIDSQVTSAQATGKALDYVFQSSKTATERQSENLVKYGTWGAIGIAGALTLASLARR